MKQMNKLMFSAVVIFLILSCSAALPYPNEPGGFRELDWGVALVNPDEYEMIIDYEDSKVYIKKDEFMHMGGAKLELLSYEFYRDMFSSVVIEVDGPDNFEALKKEIFDIYGEGEDGGPDKWEWNGDDACIVLRYDDEQKKGVLYIYSVKIFNMKEQ